MAHVMLRPNDWFKRIHHEERRSARRAPISYRSCRRALGTLAGCNWLANLREEKKGIQLERLSAAAGYNASVLTADIPKARQMVLGARGTVFVGSNAGSVHALTLDGNRVVKARTLATGLKDGSGVAFHNGALFYSDRTRILRMDDIENRLDNPPAPGTVVDGLPNEERHGARFMMVGPDNKLYISVGSPCNVCEAPKDEFGQVLRVNPDGSGREIFARGIRNTVGFDFHPQTRELWFTENGQDELGTERPNDELNRVSKVGEHFGFPYCHDTAIADPEFGAKRACNEFTPPVFGLGAHVAALGMRFYKGESVPTAMRDSIIVARHGSHPPIRVGYDVVRIKLNGNRVDGMEPFLTGFLQGRVYWGRPADVLPMPDGSVLVSDDLNGAIYRVARN